MTTGVDPFEALLASRWPPTDWADVSTLVAVSGGADSVALLRALAALKRPGPGRLVVAHFHHGWRGAEADGDAQFVERLARSLGLDFRLGRLVPDSAPGTAERGKTEAAARDARHAFLRETAHREAARYIALAHTADDQAETILHRLVRGTGVAGLVGMSRYRPVSQATTLVRPLLDLRRTDVLAYLGRIGQPFREDSSNADSRYTRNRIRHSLLPQLASDFNPRVIEALNRLASQAADWRSLLQPQIDRLFDESVSLQDATSVKLRRAALRAAPLLMLREMLVQIWRNQSWPERSMSAEHWQTLAEWIVAAADTGVQHLPDGILARRDVDVIELRRA